jgi:tetratricopeptide (TPR) repeat protein
LFAAGACVAASGQSNCSPEAATAVTHPSSANYIDLGNRYGNDRRYGCATEAFEAALKLAPGSPVALDGLSRALMANGDSASAVALLSKARLNETLAVDLGHALIQQGMYNEAAGLLNQGVREFPASQALTDVLGDLYFLENDRDRAAQLAERSLKLRPRDLHAQQFYLRVLVAKNEGTKAVPLARKWLATAPNDADLLCVTGASEFATADYSAARTHLEKAVAIDPGKRDCRYNLGLTLAHLGAYARGKEEIEKAIELGNTNPEAHYELAIVLRNLGEEEQAKAQIKLYEAGKEAAANRVLAATKSDAAAKALAAGDLGAAVSLYSEAVAAQPQDAMLAYKLSVALDKKGDLTAERAALESAVAIDPSFALAQAQLGYIDSRMDDNSGAEQHFRQALQSAPEYAQAWIGLAATLAAQSRFAEARLAVANALRLDPKNSDANALRSNLAAIADHR